MGVVYDLKKSEYFTDFCGLKFYFSSRFYQGKFENRLSEYIETQKVKIGSMYKTQIPIDGIDKFLAVSLYQQIEKRGFRVLNDRGEEVKFPNS